MAQKSKKQHIIQTALPLILENGFKGTSIDLVVKESGVSKPTVYNHFPDKSTLIHAVVEHWISERQLSLADLSKNLPIDSIIHNQWLTADTVLFYALIIGEGRRSPSATELFWNSFDQVWRGRIIDLASQAKAIESSELVFRLDYYLINCLRSLSI